ncbi:MAG: DUF2321 domain-containing protein [Thermodesulfobacteriota bacterium]
MSESRYDTAQVCMNGHSINPSSVKYPAHNQDYCSKCGEKTIQKCQDCHSPIKGRLKESLSLRYVPPSYCHNCGNTYPWTQSKLEAAKEFADELDNINEEEKEKLKESLNDLVREGPRTKLAETRFKKIMMKTGKESLDAMKSILIDIVSETIKKSLFGQ